MPEDTDEGVEFEVRDGEVEEKLKHFAESIQKELPDGWVFSLTLFNQARGAVFFGYNDESGAILNATEEMIARERRANNPPPPGMQYVH